MRRAKLYRIYFLSALKSAFSYYLSTYTLRCLLSPVAIRLIMYSSRYSPGREVSLSKATMI